LSKENEPLQTEETAINETEEATGTTVDTEETSEAAAEEASEGTGEEAAGETADEPDEAALLREELEAEQNKYLRLMADYDNFKRRTIKDRQEAEKFRAQSLLSDLLPVLDNFERALSVEAKSEEAASLLKGLEMESVGEAFDPHFHQAVMQEKDDNAAPGAVLQELQKGYILKGRVLRPAMVKVNE
jgi:molecular chaperone GrpE